MAFTPATVYRLFSLLLLRFYLFYLKVRHWQIFILLVHSPNGCYGQNWVGVKLGARSFFLVSHVVRGHPPLLSQAISRELDWKWDSWVTNDTHTECWCDIQGVSTLYIAPDPYHSPCFLKISLFIWRAELYIQRDREKISMCYFTPQMAPKVDCARTRAGLLANRCRGPRTRSSTCRSYSLDFSARKFYLFIFPSSHLLFLIILNS